MPNGKDIANLLLGYFNLAHPVYPVFQVWSSPAPAVFTASHF